MQEHGFSQREIADELGLPDAKERGKPHWLPTSPTPKEDVVTTIKHITALIDASSLGTRTARGRTHIGDRRRRRRTGPPRSCAGGHGQRRLRGIQGSSREAHL